MSRDKSKVDWKKWKTDERVKVHQTSSAEQTLVENVVGTRGRGRRLVFFDLQVEDVFDDLVVVIG